MLHLASGFRSTFVEVPLFAVQCKKREVVSFYSRAFSANFLSQYFSVAGGSKYVIQGETYVLVKLVVLPVVHKNGGLEKAVSFVRPRKKVSSEGSQGRF